MVAYHACKSCRVKFVTVEGIPESRENPFPFQDLFGTRHPNTKTKYNGNLLLQVVVETTVEIYINPNPPSVIVY